MTPSERYRLSLIRAGVEYIPPDPPPDTCPDCDGCGYHGGYYPERPLRTRCRTCRGTGRIANKEAE